jgi:hypothetical protein
VIDPLLGVFTGVLAFQLRQNNPNTAPPNDEGLESLLKWKIAQWQEQKKRREMANDAELWAALKTDAEQVCHINYVLSLPDNHIGHLGIGSASISSIIFL